MSHFVGHMAVSGIEKVAGWDAVHNPFKMALRDVKYPAGVAGGGGRGNVCVLRGRYSRPVENRYHMGGWPQWSVACSDAGHFAIVAMNEGYGGTHSEVKALELLQDRLVVGDLGLFTERAPCQGCYDSINARPHNIYVQYGSNYVDSDHIYDPVSRTYHAALAADAARAEVATMRRLFEGLGERHFRLRGG